MHKSQQVNGYLMILMAGVLWGTVGFFVRELNTLGVDSSVAAFLRIGIGAFVLVPVILSRGGVKLFKIDKNGILTCMALGFFSQAMFNFSYGEAINNVGMATASVMLYTAPIFVCIMARIFFKEQIGKIKITALLVNVCGCILTVTGGDFSTIKISSYGVFMGIMAGFLYGLMTIISKTTTEKYASITILFYSFLFGAITLWIIAKPWNNISEVFGLKFSLLALGFGLIPAVLAYLFYMNGLSKNLEASKVPVIASAETVVAAGLGILMYSESMGFIKLVGICCVLLSIGIMNLPNKKANKQVKTAVLKLD